MNPFHSIQYGPRGHFLLHFYGAVLRLLNYVDQTGALSDGRLRRPHRPGGRYPFLAHYREEIERFVPKHVPLMEAVTWWEEQVTDWQAGRQGNLPLVALERTPGVGRNGLALFMLAGLVDEDARFGTLFAHLQAPLPARRLILGLVSQLLAQNGQAAEIDAWGTCRGLFQIGALEATNPDAPRSEWMLQIPSLAWDAARGSLDQITSSWCVMHSEVEFPLLEELVLPENFLSRLRQVPILFQDGKTRALVLRGTPGSDRLQAVGAVARTMGRQVIEVLSLSHQTQTVEGGDPPAAAERHIKSLSALCILLNAIPVYTFDLGPGETASLPDLPAFRGLAAALMGFEGGLRGGLAEQSLTLTLPVPDLELRLRHWQGALGQTPVEDLEQIASRFILPNSYIRQTAAMAVVQAGLENREAVCFDDVRRAARALNRQMLDSLAERVDTNGTWDQLVVGVGTLGKLRELEQRCVYRERLLAHLGPAFNANANHGVRALFSGSSGTGKTLAARILAAELGMDLYRVDLASVINKYIGETEKNLHRVLSRAEELDIILLLDEGDALLGNRTDVKSSNDRYANLETNYLLQRLENYQGIVLVTTNAGQNIDNAFQRRMDVVVNFVPPQADERWAIWQLHLPAGHTITPELLERIAAQCTLTGGQIRNAALLASLLALGGGSAHVQNRHLEAAVLTEYRKAGAVCPLEEGRPPGNTRSQLDDFIRILA
ncbi:MAG: ATP-binding protein [Chloroflexia bacterium]